MLAQNEYQVFGPPGTGKTTYIKNQVVDAVKKHGPNRVLVASFTRAAAAELASRDLPIPKSRIGTLHSHCYHMIGSGIEVAQDHLDDWNREYPQYPIYEGQRGSNDGTTYSGKGDELLQLYDNYRAKMIPRDSWPSGHVESVFGPLWEQWKRRNDLIDFTDMIEIVYRDFDHAPSGVSIGFFDEVQDFTKLELSLVRKWSNDFEYIVLAGDDDQAIYGFKGATPDAFLRDDLTDDHKRILTQSYRVPRVVVARANRQLVGLERQEKEYRPRDVDGTLMRNGLSFEDSALVEDIAALADRNEWRIMVLASCGYMLEPIRQGLMENGVPFHNPYRRRQGNWNPLHASGGTKTADRFLAFMRPQQAVWNDSARSWSVGDLMDWSDMVRKPEVFQRGAIDRLQKYPREHMPDIAQLMTDVFVSFDVAMQAASGDTTWLTDHLNEKYRKRAVTKFVANILQHRGASALRAEPKVVIGTIHSVKGGEADVVVLSPDLSYRAWKDRNRPEQRDSIKRMFYVGMTRAKEMLVLTKPTGPELQDQVDRWGMPSQVDRRMYWNL